jgi:hypothetical protein
MRKHNTQFLFSQAGSALFEQAEIGVLLGGLHPHTFCVNVVVLFGLARREK